MLEKMGWSEGEGLGREGAGRREPVSIMSIELFRAEKRIEHA